MKHIAALALFAALSFTPVHAQTLEPVFDWFSAEPPAPSGQTWVCGLMTRSVSECTLAQIGMDRPILHGDDSDLNGMVVISVRSTDRRPTILCPQGSPNCAQVNPGQDAVVFGPDVYIVPGSN